GKRYKGQGEIMSGVVGGIYRVMVWVSEVIGMGRIIDGLVGWKMMGWMVIGGWIVLLYRILGGMWRVRVSDIIEFVVMRVGI
ncbi:sodium:solute symporter family transporter, partial [Priestia megaterium]